MSLRQDLNVPVRIAIVQLECHQAATIGGRDFLGEPFVDQQLLPLDYLISAGLTQLKSTRDDCRETYVTWHRERVMATLRYIHSKGNKSTLWETPAERDVSLKQGQHPWKQVKCNTTDANSTTTHLRPFLLIVFPEYSIPFEILGDIHNWAVEYMNEPESLSIVIFAGTHTLPPRTEHVDRAYDELFSGEWLHNGECTKDLDFAYSAELPSKSVCPIFYWDKTENGGNGKIRGRLKLKRVLSPFELSNMGAHTYHPKQLYDEDLLSVPLDTRWNQEIERLDSHNENENCVRCKDQEHTNLSMTFLPLICSEALQAETFGGERSFDIAVVPSYNKKAEAFDSIIEQISLNQHLVVFCNDGRYGGSRFAIPPSSRGEGWWLGHPNGGSLPSGDAVLIADVTPLSLAEVSGVYNPAERVQLQRISAVVPDNPHHDSYIVSECLRTLREKEVGKSSAFSPISTDDATSHFNVHSNPDVAKGPSISGVSKTAIDLELRRAVLTETLQLRGPTLLQRRKLERLLSLGPIDKAVWELHADDVVFPFCPLKTASMQSDKCQHGGDSASNRQAPYAVLKAAPDSISTKKEEPRTTFDIRVRGNERVDSRKEVLSVDMLGLERRMVKMCTERIEHLRVANHLAQKQHQYVTAVAAMFGAHPFRRSDIPEPGPSDLLTKSVWRFLGKTSDHSDHAARQYLATTVAEIVEKHHASSAWLFLYVPKRRIASRLEAIENSHPLICVIGHNASVSAPLYLEGCMAGTCVKTRRPVLHPRLVQRYGQTQIKEFLPIKKSSRSAVAVPIVSHDESDSLPKEVTGVLVLEASNQYAFSWACAEELFIDANGLSAALLFLKAAHSDVHKHFAWYPTGAEWDLSFPLNDLCYSVGTLLPKQPPYLGIGMTIWHSDFARRHAFALGAFRFDADYISQRVLPTYQFWSDGDARPADAKDSSIDILRPVSFVGSILAQPSGATTSSDWRELRLFRRQDKARRTEIDRIFATNILATMGQSSDGSQVASPALVKLEGMRRFAEMSTVRQLRNRNRLKNLEKHRGAITWYTYGGTTDSLRPHLESPFLNATASLVDRFISTSVSTIQESACATLENILESITITGVNTFNVIRNFLVELFDVDGCSIFAVDTPNDNDTLARSPVVLRTVTTSGLTRHGNEVLAEEARYEDMRPNSPHMTVRMCFDDNPESVCVNYRELTREVRPPARLLDTFTLTEFEHRRLLMHAVSVPDSALDQISIDGWTNVPRRSKNDVRVGVIRLIRSTRGRPFTSYDEELLGKIASLIRRGFIHLHKWYRDSKSVTVVERIRSVLDEFKVAVENEENENRVVQGADAAGDESDTVKVANAAEEWEAGRGGSIGKALTRLLVRSNGFGSWNRLRVESIVQDLFFAFDCKKPVLSMFRLIVRHWSGAPAMMIHAFHGHSFMELSEEAAAEPLLENEGGIGWSCISEKSLVEFERADLEFTMAFTKCHERTACGLCVPVVLPFRHGPMIGVLSIELERKEPFSVSEMALMFAAAKQISCLAVGEVCNEECGFGRSPVRETLNYIKVHLASCDEETRTESQNWEFAAIMNAARRGERDGREQNLHAISNDLAKDEFFPFKQVRWFVDRTVLDPDSIGIPGESERAYGRTPPGLEAELFGLGSIGVRIDFRSGRWSCPLWMGGAAAGHLIGVSSCPIEVAATDARKRTEAIRRANVVCKIIRESLWKWSAINQPIAFLNDAWGIRLNQKNKSEVCDGRRTWEPVCVYDARWLSLATGTAVR